MTDEDSMDMTDEDFMDMIVVSHTKAMKKSYYRKMMGESDPKEFSQALKEAYKDLEHFLNQSDPFHYAIELDSSDPDYDDHENGIIHWEDKNYPDQEEMKFEYMEEIARLKGIRITYPFKKYCDLKEYTDGKNRGKFELKDLHNLKTYIEEFCFEVSGAELSKGLNTIIDSNDQKIEHSNGKKRITRPFSNYFISLEKTSSQSNKVDLPVLTEVQESSITNYEEIEEAFKVEEVKPIKGRKTITPEFTQILNRNTIRRIWNDKKEPELREKLNKLKSLCKDELGSKKSGLEHAMLIDSLVEFDLLIIQKVGLKAICRSLCVFIDKEFTESYYESIRSVYNIVGKNNIGFVGNNYLKDSFKDRLIKEGILKE